MKLAHRNPDTLNPNSEVGRDGALRRPRRRAQRQATERTLPGVKSCAVCPGPSGWMETAQRAALTPLTSTSTSVFGLKKRAQNGSVDLPLSKAKTDTNNYEIVAPA